MLALIKLILTLLTEAVEESRITWIPFI